jgi:hypothetical protein
MDTNQKNTLYLIIGLAILSYIFINTSQTNKNESYQYSYMQMSDNPVIN